MAANYSSTAVRLGLLGKKVNIKGTTLDGNPFDWDAFQGKVVLIDFWSSSYQPGIADMRKAYELYYDRGFDVVGINLDEDTDKMNAYLKKEEIPWITLHTEGAGRKHPMAVELGVQSPSAVFLVNRDGKVVSIDARGENLNKLLTELIGPPEPSK